MALIRVMAAAVKAVAEAEQQWRKADALSRFLSALMSTFSVSSVCGAAAVAEAAAEQRGGRRSDFAWHVF